MSKIVETTTTGLQQAVGRSVLAPVGTDDVTELGTYLKASGGGGGSGFEPTEEQLAAMNSGITAAKVGIYDAIEGVPDVTSNDDGKVLTATYSGGEGTYGWASTPSVDEVPDVTSSDDGKVLTATYSGGTGSYAWAAASGGVNPFTTRFYSSLNSTQMNNLDDGVIVADISSLPGGYKIESGRYLIITTTATYGTSSARRTQTCIGVNAKSIYSRVADTAFSNNDTWRLGTLPPVLSSDSTDQTNNKNKVVKVNNSGTGYYLTDILEVPTVESTDDGKVLTATYSGGTGSFAWATASGGGGTAPTDYTALTYNSTYIDGTNTIGGYVVVNNVCTVMIGLKFSTLPTGTYMQMIASGLPKPKGLASGSYMFFDVSAAYETGSSNPHRWTIANQEKVGISCYRDVPSQPWTVQLQFIPASSGAASADVVRWVSFSYLIDT